MIFPDKKLEMYEDALETMILTMLMEERVADLEGRKARTKPKLVGCAATITNTWCTDVQVQGVIVGIAMQDNPKAALIRTVREYNKVMAEIEEKGSVVLDFDR